MQTEDCAKMLFRYNAIYFFSIQLLFCCKNISGHGMKK